MVPSSRHAFGARRVKTWVLLRNQARSAALGGVHAPGGAGERGVGKPGLAGLGQDRQGVEVRLGNTSRGQVDRPQRGESRPPAAGPADAWCRQVGAEVTRQRQCAVDVAGRCPGARCEVADEVVAVRTGVVRQQHAACLVRFDFSGSHDGPYPVTARFTRRSAPP